MSLEQQVADLTTATTSLLDAVNVRKTTLDERVETAGDFANAAQMSANAAAASVTDANQAAGEAAGSAAQALAIYGTAAAQQSAVIAAQAAASLAEGYAAAASSVAQQDLSGVTAAALHRSPNAVTAMFVYDTSKDSDGGAWTEKCQHTSWYNEPINGKWLGAHSSEANARNFGATLGFERITNGTFNNDLTGWTNFGAVTSSANGGVLNISGVNQDGVYQEFTIEAGKTYEFRTTFLSKTASAQVVIYSGAYPNTTLISASGVDTGLGEYVVPFTPTTSGTYHVRIQMRATGSAQADNISVREVTAQTTQPGDYFQLTTDGKFYKLNAGSGTTEVFRGNKRDFPRLAGIVAEAGNVTIYDLTEPGRPMFARFISGANTTFALGWANGGWTVGSLSAMNGKLFIGSTSGNNVLADFAGDDMRLAYSGTAGHFLRNRQIANRNSIGGVYLTGGDGIGIAAFQVNAVAMTVLPDAPVDPVTGLKVPTIAVATASGVSVIQHSGVVRNSSTTSAFNSIAITPQLLSVTRTADATFYWAQNPGALGASFALSTRTNAQAPDFNAGNTNGLIGMTRSELLRRSSITGVQKMKNWESDPAKSVAATITNTFNTGYQTGDIRRTYLADVGEGAFSGANIITDPTFELGVGDWVAVNGTLSSTGVGNLTVAYQNFANPCGFSKTLTGLAAGKKYTVLLGVGSQLRVDNGSGAEGYRGFVNIDGVNICRFGRTTNYNDITFVASNTTATLTITNGYNYLSSWSLKYVFVVGETSVQRSYKNNVFVHWYGTTELRPISAPITGTLTKSAVAPAAQLVAYSGFSAANYLREPYSADLDFGTGEWSVGAWVNVPVSLPISSFPVVGSELRGTAAVTTSGTAPAASYDQSTGLGTVTRAADAFNQQGVSFTATAGATYKVTIKSNGVNGVALRPGDLITTPLLLVPAGQTVTLSVTPATNKISITCPAASNISEEFELISAVQIGSSLAVDRSFSSGSFIKAGVLVDGRIQATAFDGTTTRTVTTTAAYNTATWAKAEACYTTDGTLAIRVNGQQVAATYGTPLLSLSSRRYNLVLSSEDLSSSWAMNNSATRIGNTVTFGGGAYDAFYQRITPVSGETYTMKITLSGSGDVYLAIPGKSGNQLSISLNSTPTEYVVTQTVQWLDQSVFGVYNNSATPGTTVTLHKASLVANADISLPYQKVISATDFAFSAPLTIGNSYNLDAPFPGSIALLKLSATVPTAEQSVWMYEQEKQMFREGAQCCLPDAGSIVDLAYDDATDTWVAASATNLSEWSGLVRTKVTPVPAGSYNKLAASGGVKLAARTTSNPGVDITIPAYGLREELVKRAEAAAQRSKEIVTFDFDAAEGQSEFALPVGYATKAVYVDGAAKRQGSTKDYTLLFDGFKETVKFAVAPAAAAWVQIHAIKD